MKLIPETFTHSTSTMRHLSRILTLCFILIISSNGIFAQEQEGTKTTLHRIVKHNGVTMVGKIISQDAREVLIETAEIGQVIIPKHEIKEMTPIEEGAKYIEENLFATRYFLTTNGFPVKKGDSYIQWNFFGPDFQFGIADNFGVGIMTSWLGLPIIGTAKYSRQLNKNLSGGIGFLGGTGSWAFPKYGLLLPFGFLTVGNRVNNINFSAGYGALFTEDEKFSIVNIPTEYSTNTVESESYSLGEGRPLFSIAGMFRITRKVSFVFDSFMMPKGTNKETEYIDYDYDDLSGLTTHVITKRTQETHSIVVLTPGLRFQANANSSFQFGFTGIYVDGGIIPAPIPMVQWFRSI